MPSPDLERQIALLQLSLQEILQHHPDGIGEYELLAALEGQRQIGAGGGVYASDLTLFQCHFLLFHCLYRLRDELLNDGENDLEIHCLNIRLVPLAGGDATLPARHDPLRDYYLDLANLKGATAAEVDSLLKQFWQRFVTADAERQALAILGLAGPVTHDEIKAQYRRLVMEHHPARGGNTERLQQINRAMRQLKLLYP